MLSRSDPETCSDKRKAIVAFRSTIAVRPAAGGMDRQRGPKDQRSIDLSADPIRGHGKMKPQLEPGSSTEVSSPIREPELAHRMDDAPANDEGWMPQLGIEAGTPETRQCGGRSKRCQRRTGDHPDTLVARVDPCCVPHHNRIDVGSGVGRSDAPDGRQRWL